MKTTLKCVERRIVLLLAVLLPLFITGQTTSAQEKEAAKPPKLTAKPGLYKSITNPPCSYCIVQHRKGLIKNSDRVVAWLRSNHDGGAIPPATHAVGSASH